MTPTLERQGSKARIQTATVVKNDGEPKKGKDEDKVDGESPVKDELKSTADLQMAKERV